ncbi:MAG: TonB-dependent receptor [Prevotellaceae bacterium]|nr:TonB-dependent receptor [Prevotellaceae bacterium]
MYAREVCLVAVLLVFAVSPTKAQRDSVQTDTLRNVDVVSTKRTRELKSTAPQYSLAQETFNRLGVADIGDALRRLPGITLRDYGGAGGMKTVSVRGLGTQNTGVSYDGIALSDCQTGQIDLQRYALNGIKDLRLVVAGNDDIFLPARNVASAAMIEITPPSFPIASDAEGGSRRIRSKVGGGVTLGSWGYTNPKAQLGTSIGNKVSVLGVADYIYAENDYPFTLTNGRTETRERRNNSRMSQWHGEVSTLYFINSRNRLGAKLYYYDNDRQLPGVVHYYTNDTDETLRERNAFVQAKWTSVCSDKVSLMLNGKFNWFTSDYHNGKPSGGVTSAEYWQREAYGSFAMLYTPAEWIMLDYSADYIMNNFNSSRSVDSRPMRHSVLQSVSAKMGWGRLSFLLRGLYSAYLNSNRGNNIGNTPSTSVGSAEGETEADESHFSPSISASFQPFGSEQLFIRASWKNIFRMPTFNELYYYHLGNPMLSPERTNQLNVGLSWQSGKRFPLDASLTVDGYFNDVKDKIVAIPFNMFVSRTMNIGKVKIVGVDVTTDISLPLGASKRHSVGLTGNYSLQRAMNRAVEGKYYNNQIAYTPMHSGSVTLSWENPWVNISFTADGMSERWATNEHSPSTDIEGFVEFSCSAYRTLHIRSVPITLKASVINIADKQYYIVARYPMPGRSWKASVIVPL